MKIQKYNKEQKNQRREQDKQKNNYPLNMKQKKKTVKSITKEKINKQENETSL